MITKNKIQDVKVVLTFDGQEVYDAATEPIRSVSPWIHSMDTHENGSIALVVWNENYVAQNETHGGSELRNAIITPADITQAFARLVELKATHCSGYPIQDLDNCDACTSDLILQQAIYGEVAWG